ncbi:LuxR C-terminal-related transcriptional regulator, partial [Klebsiella michiganensis]
TVHVHRANVLGKLQCHSTIDLVHLSLRLTTACCRR